MSTAPEPRKPEGRKPEPPSTWPPVPAIEPRDVRLDPAQIAYVNLRGDTTHWPAGPMWQAETLGNLDLAVLRVLLVTALHRVEDELSGRGLLDRTTPPLPD